MNSRSRPSARFRLRVTVGDVIAIGPGKVALLEAIGDTGSITAAAKQLDMSYRRAWLLLDELNQALRSPAVESAQGGARGGGSVLTPLGQQLIDTYRRIESTAAEACAADIKRLQGLLSG
ncbi:MAG TPA: winged helix-turn-helix domain-containing protein [Rhizobacter sp.]|nr:winged helix-turn-helix domain-containing protein [Rhizobacter sp.]